MPWYQYESAKGVYYSPFSHKQKIYRVLGPDLDKAVADLNADLELDVSAFKEDKIIGYTETRKSSRPEVEVPAGAYNYHEGDYDELERVIPFKLRTDHYIELPSQQDPIREEIRSFISSKELHQKLGLLFKRGILLYGPPGEGKTSLIRNLLIKDIPDTSLIIMLNAVPSARFLRQLPKEPLKVFVFEEFATIASDAREIRKVLDFLDGETSVDNSLVIATTNYPELIPGNIVDRPSRFDKLIKVGHPDQDSRARLLRHFLQREATEVEIEATANLSTAAIKEGCLQVQVKGSAMRDVINMIEKQSELVKEEFAEKRKMGFE